MDKNQKKKAIIIIVYVILFILFFGFVFSKAYSWLKPKPTCSDKIKNQNEEGVDCGGVCPAVCAPIAQNSLSILSSGFVDSGSANKYDLYAEIKNPNSDFGTSQFQYVFTLKDQDGNAIATKSGTGFILPGETKYLVENNVESPAVPAVLEAEIKDPQWVEFKDYENPQLKIINKNYNEISSGIGFSEAIGLLRNDSPFDWSIIKIKVILKNSEGKVIALNSTEVNSVRSGEGREFRTFWPAKFPGMVGNMEVQAEVNVFDSYSFVQKYFKTQKFQEYQAK